ncbi:TPA: DNA mismatch repair endonuclease MutL [Candidatus Dependentiae bacterium]|nr:DNA mismatch repair endonuclease MutL [Candidatus Dependentiae bacterium]
MAKIQILNPWEAQKIAAGEVVERPASVVKELIENAIDAGAAHINLEITNGGKSKIAIHDDGHGMSEEDALLCVQNHATSKITSVAELPQIQTFGFRGEALASIAAASKLTIITKEEAAPHATRLVFEAGNCIEHEAVAHQTGTSIVVEEIFFNIPARRKFLKKDETEWRAIHQLVSALALAHPHISFNLSHNERQVFHTQISSNQEQRFCQVLGMELHQHLVHLEHESKYAHLRGITTRAPKTRYDKNQIFVFVNRRWVKNYKLAQALIKGYDNILLPQQYPLAALFVTVPEECVDINVHPRKEEVQFLHPLGVERCIEEGTRNALEAEIKAVLQATAPFARTDDLHQAPTKIKPYAPYQVPLNLIDTITAHTVPQSFYTGEQSHDPVETIMARAYASQPGTTPLPVANAQPDLLQESTSPEQRSTISYGYTILGQLHLTYIVVQTHEGLLMIDQHAAHERILFEQFRERMHNAESIELVFPQLVRLTAAEYAALLPHLEDFKKRGIDLEPFGETTMRISALPATMKNANLQAFIEEIAQKLVAESIEILENQSSKLYEHMHATMACKAAVKAGDQLSTIEMSALVEHVLKTQHSTTCPHGRPTTWRLTLQEIERIFQRNL